MGIATTPLLAEQRIPNLVGLLTGMPYFVTYLSLVNRGLGAKTEAEAVSEPNTKIQIMTTWTLLVSSAFVIRAVLTQDHHITSSLLHSSGGLLGLCLSRYEMSRSQSNARNSKDWQLNTSTPEHRRIRPRSRTIQSW